ncbi:murein biosynthesis integral membrane protein MurJ [Ovoidimarina sediminis]|uniref:murein biosynthesis integral membrane protein MurJ n=1 Tax=Ovoidimarina sediminis TaxID=3079856 RepID=UPI0029145467|nr:murein biosynthesis integral membrane protein MurJ [Rhodophyticola sp. MJ-SS7]MDU8943702.1 murein biosynthesis integral membrane protein MurJ [Rhodophyticola sp. MJ-SS7]
MPAIRMARSFFTVGVWTLASRILGFVRDILIAATMGAGPVAEAFLIAFSLPNMFRRFFAEGAFNMAFVPMFSKKVESGEDPGGFAQDAFSGLGFLLLVFSVLAIVFMPVLVLAMASGFADDARFDLAVLYGRVVFGYIFFISLAALLSGVLNATGRFAAAAAAPVLLNVILIVALLLADTGWFAEAISFGPEVMGDVPGVHHGDLVTIGVVVAGIGQLALLLWAAKRAGYGFRITRPRLTPELKRLAIIAAPAALAGGVVQVNLLVGRQVASFFDGAVAWLSYADRLYQLPLGVVGIAIGIVLLPELSRRLQAEDTVGGREAFNRAGEIALALTVPAAVALIVMPGPLVSVLFQRGAFDAEDTTATALAVAVYGAGLPAFVLQKVLQPLYFAREDTKRPFYFALVALIVNAAIAIGLAPVIGYIAAAVGTTVAGWAMTWLLWRGARGMGPASEFDDRFCNRAPRILIAAVGMGAALYVVLMLAGPVFAVPTLRYGALALLVLFGIFAYALFGRIARAFTVSEMTRSLRRRG